MFDGSGSANGGTPAAGTSLGTNVFGSTAPSAGSAFGGGGLLFGQPTAFFSGALPTGTYETYPSLSLPTTKLRSHSATPCDDRHVYTGVFCLQREGSF